MDCHRFSLRTTICVTICAHRQKSVKKELTGQDSPQPVSVLDVNAHGTPVSASNREHKPGSHVLRNAQNADGLQIDELAGNVASKCDTLSIALVKADAGTAEPWLGCYITRDPGFLFAPTGVWASSVVLVF